MNRKQQMQQAIGAIMIGIAGIAAVVGLVYALTGLLPAGAMRWVLTFALLALPVEGVIVWRLATNSAREHLRGFDRGIDGAERTITSIGRGMGAAASLARSGAKPGPQPQLQAGAYDDLLPNVTQPMRIIEGKTGTGEVIDL